MEIDYRFLLSNQERGTPFIFNKKLIYKKVTWVMMNKESYKDTRSLLRNLSGVGILKEITATITLQGRLQCRRYLPLLFFEITHPFVLKMETSREIGKIPELMHRG